MTNSSRPQNIHSIIVKENIHTLTLTINRLSKELLIIYLLIDKLIISYFIIADLNLSN